MLNQLEVGKLFKENVRYYHEGVQFDIADDGATLLIYVSNPAKEEIEAIKTGTVKVGYYINHDIIFLLFQFGWVNWINVPYHIKLSKDLRKSQLLKKSHVLSVNVNLIDAYNGMLKVIRQIELPNKFSKMFEEDILKQSKMPFDFRDYNFRINKFYRKYNIKDLVELSKITSIV